MTDQTNGVIQLVREAVLRHETAGLTDGQLLEGFVCRKDVAALEALVRRHAPMVWGVCRRVLACHEDAEDAFQATFLVLVRKASSVVPREMVANWLYGVARQTALKARAMVAKRKGREKQVTVMPEPALAEQELWRDLQPILDEELSRLPDKYRVLVVLCDLEGKTRREVAGQLGWPEGTVAGRLARARTMLVKRLAQRGVALSGGMLAAVLSQKAVAGVPTSVVASTIKAASLCVAGKAAAGVISVKVVVLTEGVLKAMLLSKIKAVVVVVLALALLTATVGVVSRYAAAGQGEPGELPERKSAEGPVKAENAKGGQDEKAHTAWGEEQGGVQAGLGYRPGQRRAYRLGETVTLVIRVRNVGKENVPLQYDPALLVGNPPLPIPRTIAFIDADGKQANFSPLSKVRAKKESVENQLAPGQEVELDALDIALKPGGKDDVADMPTLFARPGKYRVRMNRLAPIGSSNVLGLLATGELGLEILDAEKGKEAGKEQGAKPQDDRQLIQGRWAVAKVELGGRSAVDEGKEETEVVITADTVTVVYKTRTYPMKYMLDSAKQPRAIDLVPTTGAAEKGETFKGIYKLEEVLGMGDQLTILYSRNIAPGAERPTAFDQGQEQEDRGRRLYVLKRPAIAQADLHGEWESPVNGVGESGWLALRPDGTFRHEQRDVALGWTTTVTGAWTLEDARSLVLREQDRLQGGRPVKSREKQAEKMRPVREGGEWTLVSLGGGEFRRVKKDRADERDGKPLAFGPVLELDVTSQVEKKTSYLDLDTGRHTGPDTAGTDVAAFLGNSDGRATNGVNLIAVPVPDAKFDSATPAEVAAAVAKEKPQTRPQLGGTDRTYFFKTAEGNAGVLQVIPVKGDANVVKVRWKLVSNRVVPGRGVVPAAPATATG